MIVNLIGSVLISLGIVVSFGNIYIPIKNKLLKNKKCYSMVPVIGGVFVFTGFFIFNDFTFSPYYLIFLFTDPGCVLLVIAAVLSALRRN